MRKIVLAAIAVLLVGCSQSFPVTARVLYDHNPVPDVAIVQRDGIHTIEVARTDINGEAAWHAQHGQLVWAVHPLLCGTGFKISREKFRYDFQLFEAPPCAK